MDGKGSNLSIVKEKNGRLIRRIIYEKSQITRTEIAQQTELSLPTIATNVSKLLSAGVVYESRPDIDSKLLGRKPVMLDFCKDFGYFVGVDLNPYHTYFVLTDLRGGIISKNVIPAAEERYQSMLDTLSTAILRFIDQSPVPFDKIIGIGVCLPGFIEADAGIIHNNRRSEWNGMYLARDLQERLKLQIRIENNVRARAIGCVLFQREFNANPLLYYYISRGLGCSIILDRNVLYGVSAGAGEVGHMVVDPNGPVCETCGNRGCLEAVASESAILRQCRHFISAGIPTLLTVLQEDPDKLTIDDVLRAQTCNDKAVCGIMLDVIRHIGLNIANLSNFVSPQTVVINSRLFDSAENQLALSEVVANNVFGFKDRKVNLVFMPHNSYSGAVGAAATAVSSFFLDATDDDITRSCL